MEKLLSLNMTKGSLCSSMFLILERFQEAARAVGRISIAHCLDVIGGRRPQHPNVKPRVRVHRVQEHRWIRHRVVELNEGGDAVAAISEERHELRHSC